MVMCGGGGGGVPSYCLKLLSACGLLLFKQKAHPTVKQELTYRLVKVILHNSGIEFPHNKGTARNKKLKVCC